MCLAINVFIVAILLRAYQQLRPSADTGGLGVQTPEIYNLAKLRKRIDKVVFNDHICCRVNVKNY